VKVPRLLRNRVGRTLLVKRQTSQFQFAVAQFRCEFRVDNKTVFIRREFAATWFLSSSVLWQKKSGDLRGGLATIRGIRSGILRNCKQEIDR
jgi:hypothetical protein